MTTHAPHDDPRRWLTLVILIVAAFIVVLDNSVLNVAIPTILREFDTSLRTLQWVITGYALTFATLLIIGGRLGDVYGHRRIFMVGTVLFGVGSLVAALSQNVTQLILGEAIIEGIGASMLLPSSLAILSGTFRGHERATAFAAWGATAGVAAAVGPVVGGFLTTNFSWRWSFGINVIIAPLALLGIWLFTKAAPRGSARLRVDVSGALLIAAGMFLLVFGLSEGSTYGWWSAREAFHVAGWNVWPVTRPVSVTPMIFVLAAALLLVFYVVERRQEARQQAPLFEFGQLRFLTYRYGLLTGLVVSMGLFGMLFVLPEFLQGAKDLSAVRNGLWVLPSGLFVILGAQAGGRLARRVGPTWVVRLGLLSFATGVVLTLRAISLDITAWDLVPAFAFYGLGVGFSQAQLTNVVLSEIPPASSGVASGANATVRQVGAALGVAVIGALLTTQTISHATSELESSSLAPGVRSQAVAGLHALGVNYASPTSTSSSDADVVHRALQHGLTSGTRVALVFILGVVVLGGIASFLIPSAGAVRRVETERPVIRSDVALGAD